MKQTKNLIGLKCIIRNRPRSEDDHGNPDSKKPQPQKKPVLQPPKIILSQN